MYNWGIIGTGWIAHEMGEALNRMHYLIRKNLMSNMSIIQ